MVSWLKGIASAIAVFFTVTLPLWGENLIKPPMNAAMGAIQSYLGESISITTIASNLSVANGWIPLAEFFLGLVGFLTFTVSWMTFKMIWKLIPTTG